MKNSETYLYISAALFIKACCCRQVGIIGSVWVIKKVKETSFGLMVTEFLLLMKICGVAVKSEI